MRKRNLFFKVLLFTLILPCMLLFTACWENTDTSVTSTESITTKRASIFSRSTPLTDAELGYGGFTRDDWSCLTNNELNGLSIDTVFALSSVYIKGFEKRYTGATQEKFNGLASRLFSELSANMDVLDGNTTTIERLKFDVNGVEIFSAMRQVAEKKYKIEVSFYSIDMDDVESLYFAGDLIVSVFEIDSTSMSNPLDSEQEQTWFTPDELEAINLPGLTVPSNLSIVYKHYSDNFAPSFTSANIEFAGANLDSFTSFATTLFNDFSVNKDFTGTEISSLNDAIVEHEDFPFKDFSALIKEIDFECLVTLRYFLNDGKMTISIMKRG